MTWAIGDIQGCYKSLEKLLQKIEFDPVRDRLWIAGDLVNRGHGSLETLQYLYSISQSVTIVLGNHDITLLAAYYGLKKSNPTLDPILLSPDAPQLVTWLSSQKLLHVDSKLGYAMAHAGISPDFDLISALEYASRVEAKLKSGDTQWLSKMFSCKATKFKKSMGELDLDRYILSSFTRMRFCSENRSLDFDEKLAPSTHTRFKKLSPWFEAKERKPIKEKIIFGHWSTLGFYNTKEVCCLDGGCVWHGTMIAMRLDGDEKIVVAECGE